MSTERILKNAVVLAAVPLALVAIGCQPAERERSEPAQRTERWATTENTAVPIDWDKLNEAYKLAEGPEDLERRVNEIHRGDDVISISVADLDDKTQIVSGFIDRNASGTMEEGEKIFAIRRDITSESTANVQTTGYGPYVGYHSPMFGIATGMLMGSMMSRAFMPGYVPMYQQPYTTPPSRISSIHHTRSSYRAAHPNEFQRSKSGRTYNRPSTGSRTGRGGRFGGGGKFGVRSKGNARRLAA